MPVYEYKCGCGPEVYESYRSRFDSPDPKCPKCGGELTRLMGKPNVIWCKSYGAYGDPSKEGYSDKGIYAYRTKSSRHTDGTPERVYLETVQQVREYCKAEGLRMPDETNPNAVLTDGGRKLSTVGQPGQWI